MSYDIRQALFDLRHQVNAIRDESDVPWDFVGDVAVTVKHEGIAKEFGDLLLRAYEERDNDVGEWATEGLQLLFDILFMHATSVLDWRELGKRKHWGSSIDASGRPDEVRFEARRIEEGPRRWRRSLGEVSPYIFQVVLTVTSLPSAYAKHGRQHGWTKNLTPRTPHAEEYILHAHWPVGLGWNEERLLPRMYRSVIEASLGRSRTENVAAPTKAYFAGAEGGLYGDATFGLGMDFYAMWIAIKDHTTFVENLAKAHKELRW